MGEQAPATGLNIEAWNQKYTHTFEDGFLVKRLASDGFNREQIAKILNTIEATCRYCYDAPDGCQCWNDE